MEQFYVEMTNEELEKHEMMRRWYGNLNLPMVYIKREPEEDSKNETSSPSTSSVFLVDGTPILPLPSEQPPQMGHPDLQEQILSPSLEDSFEANLSLEEAKHDPLPQ